jgi:hypothetical protein
MAESIIDSRDKKLKYDINRVDFEWVEEQTKPKELHQAYEALKEDGGFPDLIKACEKKLKEIDPAFKRKMEGDKLTFDEQRILSEDISNFITEMQ